MRYINLPIIQKNNNGYLSTFDTDIPLDKFQYKIVKYNNERLDFLADKYFDDGTLWYIIALFNKITNPLLITKDYLIIPTDINAVIDYIQINNKK